MRYLVNSFLLSLFLFLTGCGSASKWSETTENRYLTHCNESVSTPKHCQCLLNHYEGYWTEDEYKAAVKESQESGITPQEVFDADIACEDVW